MIPRREALVCSRGEISGADARVTSATQHLMALAEVVWPLNPGEDPFAADPGAEAEVADPGAALEPALEPAAVVALNEELEEEEEEEESLCQRILS